MKAYDFIFSKRFSHRILLHAAFWLVFLVYFYYVNLIPSRPEDLVHASTYLDALRLMIYFPVSVISVYVSLYFLLPRFILTEKYFQLLLVVSGLTIAYFLLALLITLLLARLTTNVSFADLPVAFKWFQPVRYGIGLPLTSAVLTTIIKLFKTWQHEQKENEMLQREKISKEMQLLKTQFQPNFLFNSLRHIGLLLDDQSPLSASAILKLSDLLSYILYENEMGAVALEQELEMVNTYLEFERTFYPERVTIELEEKVEDAKLLIAPVLLVSLIENCFENFLSELNDPCHLLLAMRSRNNQFTLHLSCHCKCANMLIAGNNEKWQQSLKRIKMLYAGKHHFEIQSSPTTISLDLGLELEQVYSSIKHENEAFILS